MPIWGTVAVSTANPRNSSPCMIYWAFSVVRVIKPVDNFLAAQAVRMDARRPVAIVPYASKLQEFQGLRWMMAHDEIKLHAGTFADLSGGLQC